ncbi:hypothetical protein B0H16DRAFT_355271 [Mycena metata]|uniref:Transmembrane protein n=1 Tax=Mycena metata TaxID=1033252 RepID=A0AAD7NMY8_9AGAR|nr:hypothetical protein B0H16DRAFT_355271 [Mycena metata]
MNTTETFPNVGFKFLSASIHFFGVTILTHFLSRRLASENLFSREGWARLTWPRLCILLVFLDSYLFVLSAGLLLFGVGLQHEGEVACSAGIFLCVAFYATSKILIYCYLAERVHIVWDGGVRRRSSPIFLICMGTVLLYLGVVICMVVERIAYFRDGKGVCVIGIKRAASLSLLSFDLYINVLLTSLFLWPILRTRMTNAKLKRIATRTLVASLAALTTSTVNIAILTAMYGREFGWVCLGSCGSDVLLNAAALFWVTNTLRSDSSPPGTVDIQLSLPSLGSTVPPTSARGSVFRSFRLRPKPPTPVEFQVHVTTASEVEKSPPSVHAELPEDVPEPDTEFITEIDVGDNQTQDSDETKRNSEVSYQKKTGV